MAINLGNKKFKRLYKGDNLVTQVYKGDELIHRDVEALYGFKFTVNPKYKDNNSTTTDYTVKFTFEDNAYTVDAPQSLVFDWGDGVRETHTATTKGSSMTVSHRYAAAGEYQIIIIPNVFQNGSPVPGWLSPFQFDFNSRTAHKVIHYDTPLPPKSVIFHWQQGYSQRIGYWPTSNLRFFVNTSQLTDFPMDFYDNLEQGPGDTLYTSSSYTVFQNTFANCGSYVPTSPDVYPFARALFRRIGAWIDWTKVTAFTNMFMSTFSYVNGGKANNIRTNVIPADLFDFVSTTENVTGFRQAFYNTFAGANYTTYTIPEGLFDFLDTRQGTDFYGMFNGTFSQYGSYNSATTIPANLFAHVDTSLATTVEQMFSNTFASFGRRCPANSGATIPAGLFDCLTAPQATSFAKCFSSTFYATFEPSTSFSIPAGLFATLSTGNSLNFSEMFFHTFYSHSSVNGVPATLFSNLNTQNGTNFAGMFSEPFWSNAFGDAIPDTLFSALNTGNGTNFGSMFSRTFSYACNNSTTATLPEHIFDFLDTGNGTNFANMFSNTFSYTCNNSPMAEIPAGLFSALDTSKGKQFSNMFEYTFYECCSKGTAAIPATLFSFLDMSLATSVAGMFYSTFYACFGRTPSTSFTIPALFQAFDKGTATSLSTTFRATFNAAVQKDCVVTISPSLFSTVDTSGVTNFYQAFCETFINLNIAEIPQGLYGGFDISSATNKSDMFRYAFGWTAYGPTQGLQTIFNDVFDGMTDFSWVGASTASNYLAYMFSGMGTDHSVGNASDILQHFNFVPNNRTGMFSGRTGLTDYATINTNWK